MLLDNATTLSQAEEWRPVVNYEGWYEISDKGRIRRSAPGIHTRIGRVLSPRLKENGYFQVGLTVGNVTKYFLVHKLVAEAFYGRRPLGMQINHKDADKKNNRMTNLEYVSPKENTAHAVNLGLNPHGETSGTSVLKANDVMWIRMIDRAITNGKIAAWFNVSESAISKIRTGRTWKHLLKQAPISRIGAVA